MKWYSFEDRICCLVYLKNHVHADLSIGESTFEAMKYGVNKKESSIRMKFSNIAAICDEFFIKSSKNIKRLDHYSRQNLTEFLDIMNYSLEKIESELSLLHK